MFSGPMRIYYFAGAALLLAGVLYVATRSSIPDHPDPEIAKIDRLERKGDAAGLTESLKAPREDVVCRAIVALAHVSGKGAKPTFERLFADPRVSVRSTAADQFASSVIAAISPPCSPYSRPKKIPKPKPPSPAPSGRTRAGMA